MPRVQMMLSVVLVLGLFATVTPAQISNPSDKLPEFIDDSRYIVLATLSEMFDSTGVTWGRLHLDQMIWGDMMKIHFRDLAAEEPMVFRWGGVVNLANHINKRGVWLLKENPDGDLTCTDARFLKEKHRRTVLRYLKKNPLKLKPAEASDQGPVVWVTYRNATAEDILIPMLAIRNGKLQLHPDIRIEVSRFVDGQTVLLLMQDDKVEYLDSKDLMLVQSGDEYRLKLNIFDYFIGTGPGTLTMKLTILKSTVELLLTP